jgi:hypothetical protein
MRARWENKKSSEIGGLRQMFSRFSTQQKGYIRPDTGSWVFVMKNWKCSLLFVAVSCNESTARLDHARTQFGLFRLQRAFDQRRRLDAGRPHILGNKTDMASKKQKKTRKRMGDQNYLSHAFFLENIKTARTYVWCLVEKLVDSKNNKMSAFFGCTVCCCRWIKILLK